ncbi:diacylglycerol/lipid kinase family protein [Chondromyces crocatus]|uniref:Sphingosine kinase n=1 Tax=Chondromyces crocatus TaxID=52 RepID=A0A0K1E7J2_CHOCO|nr:diacylglycerol kinase family protein [Chondromyces crocatus]AKT36829.1 sphingosine kinase [Chondromyces crocatus]
MPRPLAIVLNCAARERRAAATRSWLVERLRAEGFEVDLFCVDRGGDVIGTARRAVAQGYPAVVAAGGDGTISAVASAVVGTSVCLGVLPVGTINHFARSMGIPADLSAAVKLIGQGSTRQVDAGEVNGHVFVNNSTFGLHPSVVRYRDELRVRRGMNKWVAYAVATAALLPRHQAQEVLMTTRAGAERLQTPFVFIGNHDYLLGAFLLGMLPAPGPGELGVGVAQTGGRLGLVRLLGAAALGRLHAAREFAHFRSPEIRMDVEARRVLVALDGEVVELTPPLRYRSLPGALRVITPERAAVIQGVEAQDVETDSRSWPATIAPMSG